MIINTFFRNFNKFNLGIGAIVGTTSNDMLVRRRGENFRKDLFIFLFQTRIWINLPVVLFGILSLIAAFLVLMLPETLNKTLPQTIEDTEQMGLSWYVFHILFYIFNSVLLAFLFENVK